MTSNRKQKQDRGAILGSNTADKEQDHMSDTSNGKAPAYRVVENHRADDLFRAPTSTPKWATLVADLLGGNAIFVPGMTRLQLESLRTVIRYRAPSVLLLSRSTEVDGTQGRLLRITNHRK